MSADNGIYLLELKDEYRIIHAQGIENLWWSFEIMGLGQNMIPTRVIEYFDGSISFNNKKDALEHAKELSKDCDFLEYGIRVLHEFKHKTWKEVIVDAKRLARKEIEIIENMEKKEQRRWKFDIVQLKEILNMN